MGFDIRVKCKCAATETPKTEEVNEIGTFESPALLGKRQIQPFVCGYVCLDKDACAAIAGVAPTGRAKGWTS